VPRRSEFVEADLDLEDEAFVEEGRHGRHGHPWRLRKAHGGAVGLPHPVMRGGKGRGGMETKEDDFIIRLFSADTHTEILFFSSTAGMAYKQNSSPPAAWRAAGAWQGAGRRSFRSRLASASRRRRRPPQDEEERAKLNIPFATESGGVRRNLLTDFLSVNRAGKIADEAGR